MDALLAVPLAFGFNHEAYAGKMKPLVGTLLIVTSYHVTIGNIATKAVSWFS